MKYVSLFSGIEAATVAWEPLGWEPVCFAELDEFPSAVLAERYPTLTADWHNPAVYPIDEPITMADINANTAIGYDMVGTLKVGGDAPSVCL